MALKMNKLVIPVYPGGLGTAFIGAEFARVRHMPSVRSIGKCNALPIHEDLFERSVESIRNKIEVSQPELGSLSDS